MGVSPSALSNVGCQRSASGLTSERTFAIRTKLPRGRGYRALVLDDDEDYTDDAVVGEPDGHARPAPIERFHRSAVGTTLAAGMFGIRDVLEPPKDETPAIVEDWAGGQPFEEPIVLRLDPDHPEDSIVMIRPRLQRKPGEPPAQ